MTGAANGTGRAAFPDASFRPTASAASRRTIQETYPPPNTTADINGNCLADDYVVAAPPTFDRDNYDVKVSFNRSSAHQIWGKLSYARRPTSATASSSGSTRWRRRRPRSSHRSSATRGRSSPTLVLDGNFGVTLQRAGRPGAGLRHQLRASTSAASPAPTARTSGRAACRSSPPGCSRSATRRRGIRYCDTTRSTRSRRRYQGGRAPRAARRLRLHPPRAEPLAAGDRRFGPRGGFTFGGNITGAPGYRRSRLQRYAAFLLGLPRATARACSPRR